MENKELVKDNAVVIHHSMDDVSRVNKTLCAKNVFLESIQAPAVKSLLVVPQLPSKLNSIWTFQNMPFKMTLPGHYFPSNTGHLSTLTKNCPNVPYILQQFHSEDISLLLCLFVNHILYSTTTRTRVTLDISRGLASVQILV